MKNVHEKCSIECDAADVVSRQIMRNSFIEIKSIGKCTTYKCKRNSEAVITKELPHPPKPVHKFTSCVNRGDSLECEDMFLAVNSVKALKIAIRPYTSTHKAQITSTNSYTFAEISRQIPGIPMLTNPVTPALTA